MIDLKSKPARSVALRAKVRLVADDEASSIVKRAIQRLEARLVSGVNLQALARELDVSYSTFRHTFQRHTGSSPYQYLLELRFACAMELLAQTTQRIKRIASQVGFNDAQHFSHLFKKKSGMSPKQWRACSQPKLNAQIGQDH